MRFAGQRAVITGAASGIGRATALRMADEGAVVLLIDRDAEQLASLSSDIGADKSDVAVADITDAAMIGNAIDTFVEKRGGLEILVHCAGIVGETGRNAHEADFARFTDTVSINLGGSFILARAALRHLLAGGYGRILMLASMAGKDGNPGMAGYVASKAGLIGLVKGMGKEYARNNITINALAPAVIETPMNAATDAATVKMLTDKIPIGRFGTTDECASIICWICSREASFNTGAVFDLSGGRAVY